MIAVKALSAPDTGGRALFLPIRLPAFVIDIYEFVIITTAQNFVPDDRRCEENVLLKRAIAKSVLTSFSKRNAELVQLAVGMHKRKLYKVLRVQ